jgi:hypothetical protein
MLHSFRASVLVLRISVLLAGDATPRKPPAAVKMLDLV